MSKYYKLFKAYDVRGLTPDIDEKLFYWSGYAFIKEILMPENLPLVVNLTHDTRVFSPKFYQYLAQGILDAGGQVIPLGFGSTDMLYTACVMNGNPGIQVTASHNPKDYHGMKIVKKVPDMLGLDFGLAKVRDFVISKEDTELKIMVDLGQNSELNDSLDVRTIIAEDQETKTKLVDFYTHKLIEEGSPNEVNALLKAEGRKLKVVVDAGNGMGGLLAPMLQNLYTEVEFVPLYWDLDGTFPNHEPNPEIEANQEDLKQKIVETKANFGVMFDGDADRAVIFGEDGEMVKGDFLVSIFAKNYLQDYKTNPKPEFSPTIVYVQPGSRCVPDTILENDGIPVATKQGHIFLKKAIAKHNALYGGEFSGHHYFGSLKGMDSGSLPIALFIKIYANNHVQQVGELYNILNESYFLSDLMGLKIPEGQSFEAWKQKLEEHYADAAISYLDGISIFYPDWKFSMRPSNTEPIVRFILETRIVNKTAEKVAEIKQLLGLA